MPVNAPFDYTPVSNLPRYLPGTFLKHKGVGKHEADNNAGILSKLLFCEVAFESKIYEVLNNFNNSLF